MFLWIGLQKHLLLLKVLGLFVYMTLERAIFWEASATMLFVKELLRGVLLQLKHGIILDRVVVDATSYFAIRSSHFRFLCKWIVKSKNWIFQI